MGMMHVRKPKNFVLEERLERYAAAIEQDPTSMKGKRREAYRGRVTSATTRIHLDLGCGKGDGLVRMAQADPSTFFIGVDQEPICIAYAAQKLCEAELDNALCAVCTANDLGNIFAASEVDELTINFPTPQPKKRNAHLRLVHADKLAGYRAFLAEEATLTFRTDSKPLWLYAKTQFEPAGYRVLWTSENVCAEHPECPETEYEARTVAKGATIYGICAVPTAATPTEEQLAKAYQAEQSLAAYLPEDLESLDYVPIGMEDTVFNMKNRARKGKTHLPQE